MGSGRHYYVDVKIVFINHIHSGCVFKTRPGVHISVSALDDNQRKKQCKGSSLNQTHVLGAMLRLTLYRLLRRRKARMKIMGNIQYFEC